MLLALGPLLLDTALRTVVVGVVDGSGPAAVGRAAAGADALWLRTPGTPDEVADVCRAARLPVGVTAADVTVVEGLVAAGAAAVECGAEGVAGLAASARIALWCDPRQAEEALAAGLPPTMIVAEGNAPGVPGATVEGGGPATWGGVVGAVLGGARIVRTTDVRAVRRVVTVTDRLLAARACPVQDAPT